MEQGKTLNYDIHEINKRQKKLLIIWTVSLIVILLLVFILSLSVGHYGFIDPNKFCQIIAYMFTGKEEYYCQEIKILQYIRLPRSIAAFLIGGSLSVSGLVYQNTFNNKLVSPDILGVNSGCCVGAGVAILLGISNYLIGVFAFLFGIIAVAISLILPKFFKNKSSLTLVLSGIIVGAFMSSIIGIIKYVADKNNQLSAITFWMMGSLSGVTLEELISPSIIILLCLTILILMNFKIDIISFGRNEASSLGINYKLNRLIIIGCSTLLTAAAVSISGNVGWVGLVIPHITRAMVGNRSKETLPISFLCGGIFMMIVDMLSRTISVDEIPLSIITGILGAIIYTAVLIKKGRIINE